MTLQEKKAVVYMALASFLFSVVSALAKLVSHLGALEITFFRNAVGLVILAYLFSASPLKRFDVSKLHLLFFRGLIGTLALIAFFYNVSLVSLADAATLAKTEPLFSALLGFFIFKERLDRFKIAALLVGFCGVFIIGVDKGIQMAFANLVGILGGFGAALAYTTIRALKDSFDHRFVVLSFMGFGTVLPLFLSFCSPFFEGSDIIKSFIAPSPAEFVALAAIGVLSAIAQTLMTKAYFAAKAGIVSAVSYLSVLFGVIFGLLLGDNLPTFLGFLGMGFIIASGILILTSQMGKARL